MPVSTWRFKSQDTYIRHVGPNEQDFYAAFGLGENGTSIAPVDLDDVALVAIQGLIQGVEEQDAEAVVLAGPDYHLSDSSLSGEAVAYKIYLRPVIRNFPWW